MRPVGGEDELRERFVRSFLDWVLLSILRRRPAFGYEMMSVIKDEFGLDVSPGSLYPALYNLERAHLVVGEWEHPDRRTRKVFHLTPEGEVAYRDGFAILGRVLDALHRGGR